MTAYKLQWKNAGFPKTIHLMVHEVKYNFKLEPNSSTTASSPNITILTTAVTISTTIKGMDVPSAVLF